MGLSLGDAAIAFAGGALEKVNNDLASESQSRQKRRDRVNELRDAQTVKLDESKYAKQYAKYEKEEELIGVLEASNGNKFLEQRAMAEFYGHDVSLFETMQKNGKAIPDFTFTRTTKPGGPQFKSTLNDKGYLRMNSMTDKLREMVGAPALTEEQIATRVKDETSTAPAKTWGGRGEVDWRSGEAREVRKTKFIEDNGRWVLVDAVTGTPIKEGDLRPTEIREAELAKAKLEALPDADKLTTSVMVQRTYLDENQKEQVVFWDGKSKQMFTASGKPMTDQQHKDWVLKGEEPMVDSSRINDEIVAIDRLRDPVTGKLPPEVQAKYDMLIAEKEKIIIAGERTPEGAGLESESKKMWKKIGTDKHVMLTVNNKTGVYRWGGELVDIKQWEPVTDVEKETQTVASNKKLDAVESRITNLANFSSELALLAASKREVVTGVPGTIIDVTTFLQGTMLGIAELLGVEGVTIEDRIAEFDASGVDVNEFIREDFGALRGLTETQAKLIMYSLAGVNKDISRMDRTNTSDIKVAAEVIRNISSLDAGVGAIHALQYTISVKMAGAQQDVYKSSVAPPLKRADAGMKLLEMTVFSEPGKYAKARIEGRISTHRETGEVTINIAKKGEKPHWLSLDDLIREKGGFLRPPVPLSKR